jgi:ATP-dependent Zn protease
LRHKIIERYWAAVHECGHAVMSLDLGVPVFEVSIIPDVGRAGVCWHACVRDYTVLDYQIVMAGPWAEAWVNDDRSLSWGDIIRADEILHRLVDNGEWPEDVAEITLRAQALERMCQKRLDGLRPQIEKLAHELMIRQTMTGDEINELLVGEKLAA